jgi:hypothetical protein
VRWVEEADIEDFDGTWDSGEGRDIVEEGVEIVEEGIGGGEAVSEVDGGVGESGRAGIFIFESSVLQTIGETQDEG